MIGRVQPKLLVGFDDEGNMTLSNQSELIDLMERNTNWKLVRERDGLTKQSEEVKWIEWNYDGSFNAMYDTPSVGLALLMSPFNQFFTWQTTTSTEIVEQREDYIKFKTQNSNYELWKLS